MDKKQFKGVIKLDVRDSKPDWGPYTPITKHPRAHRTFCCAVRRYRPCGLVALRRQERLWRNDQVMFDASP